MSWVTIIWSMNAAGCLTLAAVHVLVWTRRRTAWANFFFSLVAVLMAAAVVIDLSILKAGSPDEYATRLRWLHVPAMGIIVAMVGFVFQYLRAGRRWLAWTTIGLRAISLVLNFAMTQNLNFREITRLRTSSIFGEPVVMADGVLNPWMIVGQASLVLFVVFVLDATIAVWRRGDRRQAIVVGGGIVTSCGLATGHAILGLWGFAHTPLSPTIFFVGLVAAMGYEMSRSVLDGARLSDELRRTHEDMRLAAAAANMALWTWDVARDRVWTTDEGRQIFGIPARDEITVARFLDTVHPEDRARVQAAVNRARGGGGDFAEEFRIVRPTGAISWISVLGRAEFDAQRRVTHLRGITLDITERKRAGHEAEVYRSEVAHLSRVTTLGEISGSLAHELNQPLGAILANTEAAELHLQRATPDLEEVRKILADIRTDDLRAGEIIHGMRDFLRRRQLEKQPVDAGLLVAEAVRLVAGDAAAREVTVGSQIPPGLPFVVGDRIQLQQVLVNLLVNAMDAVATCPTPDRRVMLSARPRDAHTVEIAVADAGIGISPADLPRVFEPFHTTKPGGLGLGLPICRSILEGLGGGIAIENNPDRGATVRITLAAHPPRAS